MRLLVIFILILSLQVFACENVNLYQSRPEIFEQKIVNQGDMSTCYAHSLATIYNLEHADDYSEKVNPYWIAFNHKDTLLHWKPKNLDYSLLSWAHRDLRIAGLCNPNVIRKRFRELKQGIYYSDDQLMFLLKTYFKKKAFRMGRPGYNFDKIIAKVYQYVKENSKGFKKSWELDEVSTVLNNIEHASRFKDFFSFLKYDVYDACLGNIRNIYSSLKSFGRGFASNNSVANRIDNVLAQNKPLAIGYCPKRTYLNDPLKTKDLTKFKPRIARAAAKNCGAHYSVLVGSRISGNSCEYLVRNTYGTGYWAHENVKCWCVNRITRKQEDCTKASFDSRKQKVLGCWFEKDKLLNNTYDLSFFR